MSQRNRRFVFYFVFTLLFDAAAFYSGYEMGKIKAKHENINKRSEKEGVT
jgi:hypothetical protein